MQYKRILGRYELNVSFLLWISACQDTALPWKSIGALRPDGGQPTGSAEGGTRSNSAESQSDASDASREAHLDAAAAG